MAAEATSATSCAGLIDPDDQYFKVNTRIYTDPSVFDEEMDRIFLRHWVYVGHSSQVPEKGDCYAVTVGPTDLILLRDESDSLRIFVNRCPVGGDPLVTAEYGQKARLVSKASGIEYDFGGRPVAGSEVESGTAQLEEPAAHESFKELQFVRMIGDGVSLDEHLGSMRDHLIAFFDRSPLGSITVLDTPQKLGYPGNWKWQSENGLDGYHGNYVHDSWQRVLQRSGESNVKELRNYRDLGCTRGFEQGFGILERPPGENPNASWTGRMMQKFPEYREAMHERYTDEELSSIATKRLIYIFPNLYLFDTHIRVINPVQVDWTDVHMHVYGLDGVPSEMNQSRYRAHERFFGASGFGTPDDLEIFAASQTGCTASSSPWSLLNRGQNRETLGETGERIGSTTDETPQRSLYRAWQRQMA